MLKNYSFSFFSLKDWWSVEGDFIMFGSMDCERKQRKIIEPHPFPHSLRHALQSPGAALGDRKNTLLWIERSDFWSSSPLRKVDICLLPLNLYWQPANLQIQTDRINFSWDFPGIILHPASTHLFRKAPPSDTLTDTFPVNHPPSRHPSVYICFCDNQLGAFLLSLKEYKPKG